MPAIYAHYRFGKQLLPHMPPDVRQCIQRFRRMYDMGLQGPDFFLYYNPFGKTAVGDLAHVFHSQSGQEFFTRVCAAVDSEAAQAYLYGLLGHYCLDSVCHPYINRMDALGEVRHMLLEAEFDRFLLAKDKLLPPHTQDLSRYIRLTRGECMTVAAFYPPATGGNVNLCVKNMALLHKLGADKNRTRTEKLLKKLKPGLCNGLIPEEAVTAFARMDS